MYANKITGDTGEDLAADWLRQAGYTIVARNWRYKRCEVDIISTRQGRLHFVEVKTRTSATYGLPEESIDQRKMSCLKQAALAYQAQHQQWVLLQFDVLSLSMYPGQPVEYYLIEDVFF